MKPIYFLAVIVGANAFVLAHAQQVSAPGLGEAVVTASRSSAPYAQQDRPVVGLRRRADSVVTVVDFNSDSRDAETRKREISSTKAGIRGQR